VPVVVVSSTRLSEVDRERLPRGIPVLSKANLTRDVVQAALDSAIDRRATPQPPVPAEPS
jgi:hypothetical protein